jgi:hypothetical protein
MRIPRFRVIAGLISGPAIIASALVASTPASASPVLTPPPPAFMTCKTVGNGFICEGTLNSSYAGYDTGIGCGSGEGAFDVMDQGTVNQHFIYRYNTDGNQTELFFTYQASGQYSNPLTGAVIPYIQHQNVTDVPAVPGDWSIYTDTVTGQNNFTVPGMGAVALNAGKFVFHSADGSVEFSGPQQFDDYYFNGNTAAVAELCTALGAS